MSDAQLIADLEAAIKSYPGFPKEGIVFRDFLPILQNPKLLNGMVELFAKHLKENSIPVDCVVGLESRGFLIGPLLALKLSVPFVAIRKSGKLPGNIIKQSYSLEYGLDSMEIQVDSIKTGQRVVIIDDLLATGGTMEAAVKLVKKCGGIVQLCIFVIELKELEGCLKVPANMFSLFKF